ncbi:MAG TPA: cyanophycin synthetase, partial [Bacillota bacterium]
GVPVSQALKYITEFCGVKRRFQIKGERNGVLVVDDYAHHPSAITTTLQTARTHFSGRIWCVFQPHLYSRTKHLLPEFAKAFNFCDIVVLADIFAAREKASGDVSSQILAVEISKYHPDVRYLGAMAKIKEHLLEQAQPGDLIITMGAGDIWKVGEEYLAEALTDEYATACGAAKGSANPQANDKRLSVVQINETQ